MKVADVNKLINLAERMTKALEKIAKELHRQNNLLGGDLLAQLEKPTPKPDTAVEGSL